MLSRAAAVAAKDLRLSVAGAQGPAQTVLLGLILIFILLSDLIRRRQK